ncbi:hypothetical protein [Nocardioides caldifontis]|uniref:hypothetical protein n=1 Tax=Nocardioides caldifontis TaxID=2588938 RepID=UPI0011DF047F|nr:hypothetical protein [Nocardioides caldifontis]
MTGAPPRLTRRFLLAAALGGTTAGCWSDEPPGPDPAPSNPSNPSNPSEEAAIFELSFTTESRYRPFALVGTEAGRATAAAPGVQRSEDGPVAPFCAVEAGVSGSDRPAGRVVLGLVGDQEHVVAFHDPEARRVGIEVRAGGRTRVVRRKKVDLPAAYRLAFALCENQVTVLVDTGDGWRPVVTERDRVRARTDLRRPETLEGMRYGYGTTEEGAGRLEDVRWGLFGMTGLRDQHLVQHADGTPYVQDGKAYFTATCAGLGFFQQAHCGVFSLDLAGPERLEHVGQLFFHRDGLLLGDHAGQLVRDGDRWLVAMSSWGDFDFDGVHVRHTESTEDLLHGVHVLGSTPTALPTSVSSWDPGITRIDGRWHVSFVESPSQDPFDFHPALAVGGDGPEWHERLELVGADTSLHQCEGPILAQVQGEWWFLASDGDARHYPVYDLRMRRVGRLDAPYGTNIPHPQLVPLEDGDHLLVTFDGTQFTEKVMGYGGHGDVIVMRSKD